MHDLLILGTDTDVGKTTLSLLWMMAYADRYDYWKPVETGPSDSAKVANLVSHARVHPPCHQLQEPVAPPLAARKENVTIAPAALLASQKPQIKRRLLIESFGSPFSPLNETELQIALVKELATPSIVVSSSVLGAIGRTLQCWHGLCSQGCQPIGIVLMGPADPYAIETLQRHLGDVPILCLPLPDSWSREGLQSLLEQHRANLDGFRQRVENTETSAKANNSVPDILERDQRVIWHPYTPLAGGDPPLVCTDAKDEFLYLADGRQIIDGFSSWWTIQHGHRPDFLVQALRDAAGQLDHVLFAGVTHEWAVELAERMLASLPWKGGRVFYSDNGSTAVEVALKMAYQTWCHRGEPGRKRFVGFEHGYHGDTFGAMAVGRDPLFFGHFEPLLFDADILPVDADRLDEHLAREKQHIAAVILEPLVQGAGGMQMHTPETLRRIVEVTHKHGLFFIADEVMTGGGRTGSLWAHSSAGVMPDLVCAGKTLAGGIMPLAATLAGPAICAAFNSPERTKTFFHGHSFTAHPLACAVGVANWRHIAEFGLPAAARFESYWRDALADIENLPQVKQVRIRGIIAAIEVNVGSGYLAKVGKHMARVCLQQDVFLRPLGNVLYAMPPFCTSPESLHRIAAAMKQAVASIG